MEESRPRKRRVGRYVALAVLLLIVAAVLFLFRIPQKLGWVKSAGAKLVEQTPEVSTAQEIVAEAEAKGFKSEAVHVYVFPKPGSGDAMLLASYDFSKGAKLSQAGTYHPVVAALVLLGGGAKATENGITHVGAEFLDEDGKYVLSVAASVADINDLQAGKITEAQFREGLGKRVDLPNYAHRFLIP
jgi:hypothetical protein